MKRVTLLDVAAHAGVSRAAASLVIRGEGRLSEETRARVLASIDALGYVYHRGAAALRTNNSSIVGMLITDISNPSFSKMALRVEQTLARAGMFTMVSNTFDDERRGVELLRAMTEYPVDAIIYVPVVGDATEIEQMLHASAVPSLAVTRRGSETRSYLGPDNVLGGQLAARHMIEVHEKRRLAFVGGPGAGAARRERLEGVRQVVGEHDGVEVSLELEGAITVEAARAAAIKAFDSGVDFDAVIAHSDLVAFAVLREAALRGRKVGVIGFDDLPTSSVFVPSVSSVAVDDFGQRAASRVLELISGAPVGVEVLAPTVIVRESCGCE